MKAERKILTAFLLNGGFCLIELIGGIITGSVAILSDAVHDGGDALSIGISYFLQRKSKKGADERYTYGYGRYSVLGAAVTDTVLIIGSLLVIYKGIFKILNPSEIRVDGMLFLAVLGFAVNLIAALVTRGGESLNQRAVNLHMLEDVLGWAVVLVGSVIIKLTGLYIIDPVMSVGVGLIILAHAIKSFRGIIDLFLERVPDNTDLGEIKKHLLEIEGVRDIHHIHLRSFDGESLFMSFHAVVDTADTVTVKSALKKELREHGISHCTVELETVGEECGERECIPEKREGHSHHGHHH